MKRTLNSKTKTSMLKRDNYTCQYCGYNIYDFNEARGLVVDHVIPYAYGGESKLKNVITSCNVCNKYLSDFCPKNITNIDDVISEKKNYLVNLNNRKTRTKRFM